MKTKIFAMYLPQYHEIPENNEWWGKGFTEWTNVKKAFPLYEGHYQPRVPLDFNYYDLLDGKTLLNQMKLAKEYGLDGFCIYHYWFNGKQLLEKPVELLLESNNQDTEFFFCWANEPWTRTWDGNDGAREILMSQNYGDKEDWIKHYRYFSAFFKKANYTKIDNKPVLCIYKESAIDNLEEMLSCWSNLAKNEGYNGLYIICTRRTKIFDKPAIGDAIYDFEPIVTLSIMGKDERKEVSNIHIGNRLDNSNKEYSVYDCEKVCQKMVDRYAVKNLHHYLGMFVGWDNTARRGINPSAIYENMNPDIFERYLRIQYEKSQKLNNEFLFINAWNEWGEGTYLEPDSKYGYGFLNAIKRIKGESEC